MTGSSDHLIYVSWEGPMKFWYSVRPPETLKAKFCPSPYVLDKSFLDPLRITKPQSVTSPLVKSARRTLVIQNKELLSPMQPKVNS